MKRFSYSNVAMLLIFSTLLFSGCNSGNGNVEIDKKWASEKFDIVVQAGQSNAEGCGVGHTDAEYVESDKVLYLNNDFTITIAKEEAVNEERINNFSLSFAREYVNSGNLESGRKLLIIRAAVGGTGFSDNRWTTDGNLNIKMHSMIKSALELSAQNRLVAVLWHQGETDAINNVSNQVHYQKLKSFVQKIRTEYSAHSLPFIAGDFVKEWKTQNIGSTVAVINAIKQVCVDLEFSAFVETDDLHSNNQDTNNGDKIHFSRDALNILGERYFVAFNALRSLSS